MTKYVVDLDFKTRARSRGGKLSGRSVNPGVGDRTAVIRGTDGRIYGRTRAMGLKKRRDGRIIYPSRYAVYVNRRRKVLRTKQWVNSRVYVKPSRTKKGFRRGTIRRRRK